MRHPNPTEEYDDEDYREAQNALPPHKRDGYGEMIFELADMRRKQQREEGK